MNAKKKRNWTVTPNETTQIVGGLFRCRNYVWNNDQRIAAGFGLTWTQFLILRALRFSNSEFTLSPTELYDATQASSGGLTNMLHGLEENGFVKRIPNPNDGRSKLVKMTAKGADIVETVIDQLVETNTKLFDGVLETDEKDQLASLLTKLNDGLQAKIDHSQ